MVTVILKTKILAARTRSFLEKANVQLMGVLKQDSLADLFWTMVLTGSFGMAISVIVISYTGNLLKELIYR